MSDIIYTPPTSGGGGTTINPTNEFIPVRSNSTTFVDSFILSSSASQNIFTSPNLGSDVYGWYIDYAQNICVLGDYGFFVDGTMLITDNNNQVIKTQNQGNAIGLDLDFTANLFKFGDFNSVSSGTSFCIDQFNSLIYTQHSGQQEGLFFDFVIL